MGDSRGRERRLRLDKTVEQFTQHLAQADPSQRDLGVHHTLDGMDAHPAFGPVMRRAAEQLVQIGVPPELKSSAGDTYVRREVERRLRLAVTAVDLDLAVAFSGLVLGPTNGLRLGSTAVAALPSQWPALYRHRVDTIVQTLSPKDRIDVAIEALIQLCEDLGLGTQERARPRCLPDLLNDLNIRRVMYPVLRRMCENYAISEAPSPGRQGGKGAPAPARRAHRNVSGDEVCHAAVEKFIKGRAAGGQPGNGAGADPPHRPTQTARGVENSAPRVRYPDQEGGKLYPAYPIEDWPKPFAVAARFCFTELCNQADGRKGRPDRGNDKGKDGAGSGDFRKTPRRPVRPFADYRSMDPLHRADAAPGDGEGGPMGGPADAAPLGGAPIDPPRDDEGLRPNLEQPQARFPRSRAAFIGEVERYFGGRSNVAFSYHALFRKEPHDWPAELRRLKQDLGVECAEGFRLALTAERFAVVYTPVDESELARRLTWATWAALAEGLVSKPQAGTLELAGVSEPQFRRRIATAALLSKTKHYTQAQALAAVKLPAPGAPVHSQDPKALATLVRTLKETVGDTAAALRPPIHQDVLTNQEHLERLTGTYQPLGL